MSVNINNNGTLNSYNAAIKELQNALCEITSGTSYDALAKVWKERIEAGD